VSGPLTSSQIRKRIDDSGLVRQADARSFAPASYEMRVGSYYSPAEGEPISLVAGDGVALAPGGFVLIGTLEEVSLPRDILGMMYLRSTYARRGFSDWFQGLVDPGYRGALTVALHNLTDHPLVILGGDRICHLLFYPLDEMTDEYDGRYQGSTAATPDAYGDREVSSFPIVGAPRQSVGPP